MEPRYVIRGGRAGYDRLRALHLVHGPATAALFDLIGLKSGMRCIDLGCGGGEVTLEIADRVGPGGSVIGVDMDDVKLSLAREEAERRSITNATFRSENVTTWREPAEYDMAYCRLLLEHLEDPVDLLRRMWEAVRPGGFLVTEDADFDGVFCDPPNAGHAFWAGTFTSMIARHGGDPTLGRKLHRRFADAGVPQAEVQVRMHQVLHRTGEGKALALLSLQATAEGIVSEGLATEEEVRAAENDLEAFTRDPLTLIGAPRIFQVWSQRPRT
jgi:ubiquinone/menaquinone biosynthesis C-methylase UbiE